MAAKIMLKDRQWHLKNNLTIFLEFLETFKNFAWPNDVFRKRYLIYTY